MSRYKCVTCKTNHEYPEMVHLCIDCLEKLGRSPQAGRAESPNLNALLGGLKSQHVRNRINDMVARLQDSLEKDASGEWELLPEVRRDYQNDLEILEKLAT